MQSFASDGAADTLSGSVDGSSVDGAARHAPEDPRTDVETFGWIGTGRMGTAMASRLVRAGYDVAVYNRTREKTASLESLGASVVSTVAELGARDVVFVMVASSEDLLAVLRDEDGLLGAPRLPRVVVDCSTVSQDASATARGILADRGVAFLAAPVSGNPNVAAAGRLTMAVSGPRETFDEVAPYLRIVAREATYVGEGDVSRLVKLCHNLFLGTVIQSLVEVTVLAGKGGVRRQDFLAFMNESVMGSMFTRYKTPALVNLDFTPTFTTRLLHKDFDLGLAAARALEVPAPVAAVVHELLQGAIGAGIGEDDFAAILALLARAAGMTLESEGAQVSDGLGPGLATEERSTGDGSPSGSAAVDKGKGAARA